MLVIYGIYRYMGGEGQTSVAVSLGDGDYEISDLTEYLWKSAANKDLRSQLVDGERAAYEKVNTAFLGLKMDKGMHEVTITYHAPGVLAGKILSVMGLILGVLAYFVIFHKKLIKRGAAYFDSIKHCILYIITLK